MVVAGSPKRRGALVWARCRGWVNSSRAVRSIRVEAMSRVGMPGTFEVAAVAAAAWSEVGVEVGAVQGRAQTRAGKHRLLGERGLVRVAVQQQGTQEDKKARR